MPDKEPLAALPAHRFAETKTLLMMNKKGRIMHDAAFPACKLLCSC
jgi:hypothetical protein